MDWLGDPKPRLRILKENRCGLHYIAISGVGVNLVAPRLRARSAGKKKKRGFKVAGNRSRQRTPTTGYGLYTMFGGAGKAGGEKRKVENVWKGTFLGSGKSYVKTPDMLRGKKSANVNLLLPSSVAAIREQVRCPEEQSRKKFRKKKKKDGRRVKRERRNPKADCKIDLRETKATRGNINIVWLGTGCLNGRSNEVDAAICHQRQLDRRSPNASHEGRI